MPLSDIDAILERATKKRDGLGRLRVQLEGLKDNHDVGAPLEPSKSFAEYLAALVPSDEARRVIMGNDAIARALASKLRTIDAQAKVSNMGAVVDAIRAVDESAADKLSICADVENWQFAFCAHTDSLGCTELSTFKTRRVRCWLRVCPRCAKDIAQRLRVRYAAVLAKVVKNPKALKHLVLTLKRSDNLAGDIAKLHAATKKTVHKFWTKKDKRNGAFATVEVGPSGGNVHAHVIVYGGYVKQDTLSKYWEKLTGCFVVHIKAIDADRAVGEAVKYITKLSKRADDDGKLDFELSPAQLAELHKALYGKRRAWAWGSFFDVDIDEELADETEALDEAEEAGDTCAQCHHVLHVIAVSELRGLLRLKDAIKCDVSTARDWATVPLAGGVSPGVPI